MPLFTTDKDQDRRLVARTLDKCRASVDLVYDHPSLEPEDLPRPTSRRKLPSKVQRQSSKACGSDCRSLFFVKFPAVSKRLREFLAEDFQNWEIEGMRVVKMVFESNGGL